MDDSGNEHPISFNGRSLRGSEKNWSITELEGLSLVEAVKDFHPFLNHQKFTVYTDHISLGWLQSIKLVNGRLYRWSLLLQGYNFEIKYKPGKSNGNADALSRRDYPPPPPEQLDDEVVNDDINFSLLTEPTNGVSTVPESGENLATAKVSSAEVMEQSEDFNSSEGPDGFFTEVQFIYMPNASMEIQAPSEPSINVVSTENLPDLQANCPDIGRLVSYLKTGDLPLDAKLARQTTFEAENYYFKNDVLYHHYQPKAKHVDEVKPLVKQVVIPLCLREEVLREFHDNAGHNGFDRTYIMLREKWFWPRLYKT